MVAFRVALEHVLEHAIESLTGYNWCQLPFDGTAELWWDSIEEMKADFASPEAEAAVTDARKFSSELIHIYTVEHIAR